MEYLESKEAFENAIKNGLETPEDYMYMYSIGKNDYFKHVITRKYRCIERDELYYIPSYIEGDEK